MYDQQVTSILKKYENINTSSSSKLFSQERNSNSYLKTERKKDSENFDMITFMNMNQENTPSKSMKQNDRFLRKLDQTQQKLALSERNYVQLWRKYEGLKVQAIQLQNRFRNQQRMHDEEYKTFKSKVNRLQSDNKMLSERLIERENIINILEQKNNRKNEQIIKLEQQYQRKLISSRNLKSPKYELQNTLTPSQISRFKEQSNKSYESLILNYQNEIKDLTLQLKKFDNMILEKQKEKKQVNKTLQEQNILHSKQIKQLRQFIKQKDNQLQKIAETNRQEKLKITNQYEQILRQSKKDLFTQKQQILIHEGHQIKKLKQNIKSFQSQISQLKDQNRKLSSQFQKHQTYVIQTTNKIQYLSIKNKQLEEILQKQRKKLKELQYDYEQFKTKKNNSDQQSTQIIFQFNELRMKCQNMLNENEKYISQNELFKDQINKMKGIVKNLQDQLQQSKDIQLNMNAKLSQNSVKMKQKILKLQSQLQQTIQDLYAQRLQKAQVLQELEDTKQELKKQYQLSLQNLERQYKLKQISNNSKYGSDFSQYDKETLYLKLKDLQRKYEMLTSEVVSVQDLLGVATKIHKKYKGCV